MTTIIQISIEHDDPIDLELLAEYFTLTLGEIEEGLDLPEASVKLDDIVQLYEIQEHEDYEISL
jgi:hypothetical protein